MAGVHTSGTGSVSAACPIQQGLKETLIETLTATLSPVQEVRAAAEEQVKVLEVTEEFGVYLAELTVDPQGALPIRQLSSVLLKQYVDTHWCSESEKFKLPETTDRAKGAIRDVLPGGLREPVGRVRSSVAYAVSGIAQWDWPEAWPRLFSLLVELLVSGDLNGVHGAMRVLTEFTREVTDTQMPMVAPVILPEMYKIFTMTEVYSIRTRSRAVEIFTTCAKLIAAIQDLQKGAAKALILPVVPQFTQAFIQALRIPDGPSSDCGLKREVLKALMTLVKNFPKNMAPSMQQILPVVWSLLTESASHYVRTEVNSTEDVDDPVDSDGEVLGFENLVFSIFEFVHTLLETSRMKSAVRKTLPELFYYAILYMQITEDQVKAWAADPQTFVEDEDDDTFSYSVRISAQDLLLALVTEFQDESVAALVVATVRHLQEAEQARNGGREHWWKVHEACMLSLGSVKTVVMETVKSGRVQFDLHGFLTNVVLADLNLAATSPFLLGRALWVASRFIVAMTPGLLQQLLQATVSGLSASQPPAVRISAAQAVQGYCEQLKLSGSTQVLLPFLPGVLDGLVPLAAPFGPAVLALVLETLRVVCTVDPSFTASAEKKICPLTIAVFLKYSNDPVVASLSQDIFKELSRIEGCRGPLQTRLIPTLISIMQAPPDKIPAGLCTTAVDILTTVVRHTAPPLPPLLLCQAFPAVAQCVLHTDDSAVMQSGGECLRAYVSVALEQLLEWRDQQGRGGLCYVLQAVSRLLDPRGSELAAACVGRLVSSLAARAGPLLGGQLDQVLRDVLTKLQQANNLSVKQSLLMVFAHLMVSRLEPLLEFLWGVPGPAGRPALDFLMAQWVSHQHLFYGQYEGKVSTVALCRLLQHGLSTGDPRLEGIRVKGEELFSPGEGIRTRSKSTRNPERWTNIPLLVKIFKLIVNELSSVLEENSNRAAAGDCSQDLGDMWEEQEEEEEEDDDADEEEGKGEGLARQLLSDLIASHKYDDDDDFEEEDEEDPDALKDPIYQIDLQVYLTDYISQLAQLPCYSAFSGHLNEAERRVLQSIGV
ncbi:importin-9 [Anguilla anguilla]|uniref:importin-9 n=1 Tax=Anguilla anguilla TaxID=7936 RepID=UPI0015AFD4F4|nr:importin-9 [Anguilla anguilla]